MLIQGMPDGRREERQRRKPRWKDPWEFRVILNFKIPPSLHGDSFENILVNAWEDGKVRYEKRLSSFCAAKILFHSESIVPTAI